MASIPYILDQQQGRPESVQAEVTILGAMLLEPLAILDATMKLRPDDFSLDSHRRIYGVMLHLQEMGHAIDLITVTEELRKRKEIEAVGGPAYIAALTEGLPRNLAIENYVRIVKDKSLLRQLMALFDQGLHNAASEQFSAQQISIEALRVLENISMDGQIKDLQTVGEFIAENYGDPDSIFMDDRRSLGLQSGFHQLDELLDGLQPGDLYVVAARPNMGKTAWVGNLINNTARAKKKKVALFTLENRKKSVLKRMLCGRALVSLKKYNNRSCSDVEKQYLRSALAEFKESPLYWDENNHLTITDIRAQCARLRRIHGLDLIIIDQLSMIDESDVSEKGLRPDLIIGRIVKAAKKMAQDLNVPVVLMAQLRRSDKKGSDVRPMLSDLKESGKIEEHADTVIFLHRPAYYATTEDEKIDLTGKEEFIVAKQRDGPTGICHVKFNAECCLWSDKPEDRHLGGKVDY